MLEKSGAHFSSMTGYLRGTLAEINYPGVAKALEAMGYGGPVCLEAFASGSAEDALAAFRAAFTV